MKMGKNIMISKWPAWVVFTITLTAAVKYFGAFVTNINSQGPVQWLIGVISLISILVLVFGITTVRNAPKEFGCYFFLDKLTGWSLGSGVWPTFGNIISIKKFPGDNSPIQVPVTVTCASELNGVVLPGRGPDVTVTFIMEAALDPLHVAEIVFLGSTEGDTSKFRDGLTEFAKSKLEEHAKNGILKRTLDSLNADRFGLVQEIISEMWTGRWDAPQGARLQDAFRQGAREVIQGLIVSALRVTSVSEPTEIKAQRIKTQVALATIETAQADLSVAQIREEQNKMEATRYAEMVTLLKGLGIPAEQIAVLAAGVADKAKVNANISVVSTSGSTNADKVAQATALGAAIGQNQGGSNE